MQLNFYQDPGHGWLAVPLPLLEQLGILDKVSGYSYMRGTMAHLEEDCDYSLFAAAMREAGKVFTVREHHTNKRSKIRGYCRYHAGVARRWIDETRQMGLWK